MRDEESAFQAALDANPLDDAVRLVYADWLEDRDDLARAASVRDRCARLGRIREKFANLKAKDQGLKVWAARSHRYHLEPPLPMAMLRELEKRYGIHFPDDYRDFVTRFAEAGAGPSYGIESVRKVCHDLMARPFPLVQADDPDELGYDDPGDAGGHGYILLAEHGCASDAFLVVCGAEAGQVWEFWGGGDGRWHPRGMTFLQWYEAWLDAGLNGEDF